MIAPMTKEKPLDPNVALNVRCMPRSLRTKFKVWCAEHNCSMESAIVTLVGMLVDRRLTDDEIKTIETISGN